MTPQRWFLLVTLLLALLVVAGCGGAPATPTKPPVTAVPAVTVMVVTATPPPATATSVLPTVAPTPVVTATAPVTTPVVKSTPVAAKVPTKTPTKPAATTGPTALPQKFAAPTLLEPIFDEARGRKDERHFPGDALIFKWGAVGGMGGDECYSVNVSMTPGQSDSFLAACGDQTQMGYPVSFMLNQPNRGGPNYSALLPNPNSDSWVSWTVTPVKNLGKGSGPQDAGGTRYKVAPLGPASARLQFLLKGQ